MKSLIPLRTRRNAKEKLGFTLRTFASLAVKRFVVMVLITTPLALPAAAVEAVAPYPDLPPPAAVEAALRNSPDVLAAQAGIKVGEAVRQRLQAGEHEVTDRKSVV